MTLLRKVKSNWHVFPACKNWLNFSFRGQFEIKILIVRHIWNTTYFIWIDLIHDTHNLCTPVEIDGTKAMSRSFSGGKQLIKASNTSSRGWVCLIPQHEKTIWITQNVQIEFHGVSVHSCSTVRISMVVTVSKNDTTIVITRILPLPSLTWQVLHVLFLRINKRGRDYLYWQLLWVVCPLRNHVTLCLSHHALRVCKDGRYRE